MRAVVFSKKLITASAVSLCVIFFSRYNLPGTEHNKSHIFAESVQEGGDAFILAFNANATRATSTIPWLGFTNQFWNASLHVPDIIRLSDVITLSVWEKTDNDLLAVSATSSADLDTSQLDSDEDTYLFPTRDEEKQLGMIQTQNAVLFRINWEITAPIHKYKY